MSKKFFLLVAVLSLLVSFLLYSNTIPGDFVYDDPVFVANRPELVNPEYILKIWGEPYRPGDAHEGVYRPVTILSFAFNYIFYGKDPSSFHVVSIILNGIAIFLVYFVSWQLFKNKVLSIFTALIFAFLPIHSEAVAFIKARDEILSAVFSLASLSVFLKAIEKRGRRRLLLILLSSILFFLAVMAKEFAIILPALLLVIYWVKEKPHFKNFVPTGLLFVPVGLIYLFIRWQVLKEYAFGHTQTFWFYSPMQSVDFLDRIWTAFNMLFLYIQKTFIPLNLSATHHFNHLKLIENPFTSWEAIAGIILALVFVFFLGKKKLRESPFGVGLILFVIPYLIFSKFTFAAGEVFAERWMYFPSFGLSLILGFVLYTLFKRQKWLGTGVLIGVLFFYAAILIPRNTVWLSEKSLHESMIADAPNSAQGYIGLAYWYYYQGNKEEAAKYLNLGQKIYHDHPRLLNLEAILAIDNKDLAKAKEAVSRSVKIRPTEVNFLLYAIILTEEGEYEESLKLMNQYLSSSLNQPGNPRTLAARYLMAVNLSKLGRSDEAKKYWDLNRKLAPTILP